MLRSERNILRAAFALALGTFVIPWASAQGPETTGTLVATVGGVERTWTTYGQAGADGYANAATYIGPQGPTTITVYGRAPDVPPMAFAMASKGGLHLNMVFLTVPKDCPCTPDDVDLILYEGGSMGADFYSDLDSEVEVGTITEVEDGVYEVSGTFKATLGYVTSLPGKPDPGRTVELVDGSFTLQRVTPEPGM